MPVVDVAIWTDDDYPDIIYLKSLICLYVRIRGFYNMDFTYLLKRSELRLYIFFYRAVFSEGEYMKIWSSKNLKYIYWFATADRYIAVWCTTSNQIFSVGIFSEESIISIAMIDLTIGRHEFLS